MPRRPVPAVLAVALLAAAPTAAHASFPGVNGRISLTQRVPAGPDGKPRANRDIFAYSRDGAARDKVTSSTDNEEQSSWSPDGQYVAYKRRDAVWISRWDGSDPHALTELDTKNGENNTQPAWSPDGQRIIFRSNRDEAPANVADIWVMNIDGSDQHPLVQLPGDERYPSFSPDGTKIVFRGDTDGVSETGDEEIFVADADGSHVVQLTHDDFFDSSPAWSPDGTRIAFQSNRDGGDQEIYTMAADGSDVRRLTDNDVHDEGPAWSPDGRRIAFTRAADELAPGDIWTMNADGSDQQPLTDTPIIEESPDWQPLPITVGDPDLPRVACGDLSLTPGGVASVVTIKAPCSDAVKLADEWQFAHADRIRGYDCSAAPHSFDQVLVQCEHRGGRKGVAFVYRTPSGE